MNNNSIVKTYWNWKVPGAKRHIVVRKDILKGGMWVRLCNFKKVNEDDIVDARAGRVDCNDCRREAGL